MKALIPKYDCPIKSNLGKMALAKPVQFWPLAFAALNKFVVRISRFTT
jgi:hypothetical protein